jgi:hypothetical protein
MRWGGVWTRYCGAHGSKRGCHTEVRRLPRRGGRRSPAGAGLYEWNAVVSAAFQRDLAHLEIALRNAYDTAIVTNTPAGPLHWTTDPCRMFPVRWRAARDDTRIDASRSPREQIERAGRVGGPGAPPGK